MKKLTPQQERFCEEYLIDLNASAAAERAGFSKKSIRSIASELMSKEHVQARITELKAERTKRVEVTQDFVLKKYLLASDLDFLPLLKPDGSWKNLKDIPEEIRKLITHIECDPYDAGKIVNIKFLPRTSATAMLAKHTGVDSEKVEVDVGSTLEGLLAGAARLKANESSGSD